MPEREASKMDTFVTQAALQVYAHPEMTPDAARRMTMIMCTSEWVNDVVGPPTHFPRY